MSVHVKIRKNEQLEKALRRFKKKVDRENIIKDAKNKRHFEKPSAIRRRKGKVAAFNNMLKQKRENGLYVSVRPVLPTRS
jgi:small subunit ribosomal protein S21